VRVHVVDPSAYTPPYDHALCAALASAGAAVELYTSSFAYGPVPFPAGYERREIFYRPARLAPGPSARRAAKLAGHVPSMLRYRRSARAAEVVHFQWLTVPHVDAHLLPRRRSAAGSRRPLVLTAHDILPREPRPGQREAQRRLYERFDAVIVHSGRGRLRLTEELGVDPERVHVIPHGVLRPWEDAPSSAGAADVVGELAADVVGESAADGHPAATPGGHVAADERPVALFFGLLRPYKGLELLLEAWRRIPPRGAHGGELWIVGMPRMDLAPLRACAPAGVRFLTRFVSDAEMLALMRRASLVVLPYRDIDHSGVALTALGAGVPLLLSDVGGFPEIAATGAARTVPAGDSAALGEALQELLVDPAALAAMADRARAAASHEFAWGDIARRTLALYGSLLGENPPR
jgi:glycosyltransferase involved in cell wall biosynthesis